MPVKKQYQDIKVGLNEGDRDRLFELARQEDRTRTEVARDAIRWYLDHYDEIKGQSNESQNAQAIRYASDQLLKGIQQGTDRICKMLNRQGLSIETLFELTYATLPDNPAAVAAFTAAANRAKEKMHRRVQKDEQDLATKTHRLIAS